MKDTHIRRNLIIAGIALLSPGIKAENAQKYNVIFIISDQHNPNVAGCYGDSVAITPNIDALARSGVTFNKMYTPSPLSAPARASLMTGMYPAANGATNHNMLPPSKDIDNSIISSIGKATAGSYREGYAEGLKVWGEYFKEYDYATCAVGKMHVHGELQKGVNPKIPQGNLMGFDYSDMRIYTHFPSGHYYDLNGDSIYNDQYREIKQFSGAWKERRDYNKYLGTTLVEDECNIYDVAVTDKSLKWIEQQTKQDKFFVAHIGLEKPHSPWSTKARFYDMYNVDDMKIPDTWNDWRKNGKYPYILDYNHNTETDSTHVKWRMLAYYSCITEMDEQVGRIIAKTKELGIYDKTIFIYTSDHGEHLYNHGLFEKHSMFDESVRIPFIISCPALLPQGIECNALASLIDVLPTLADILGQKKEKQWQGISLLPSIISGNNPDRQIFSEIYEGLYYPFPNPPGAIPKRMLLDKKYKYVYTAGMIDELYDVNNDKKEMSNLALNPKYKDVIDKYKLMTLNDWRFFIRCKDDSIFEQMTGNISRKVNSVKIKWNKVPQIKNYTVWRSTTSDPKTAINLAETTTNSFIDTKAISGKKYNYWIVGNWDLTRFSERSATIPMMIKEYPEITPILQIEAD